MAVDKDFELVVYSVSFFSTPYLALNWELTQYLNKGARWKWVVAENTPLGENDRLDVGDRRFEVRPGAVAPEVGKYRGSYHHGAALNKTVSRGESRFVLILDPDFFIVRKDWIRLAIQYMIERQLAFWGASWHPRWYRKYRYFPCVHCMLIDLDLVDVEKKFDFTPDLANNRRLPPNLPSLPFSEMWHRLLVGSSRDTGYHLYQNYGHNTRIRSETVKPVFRPGVDAWIPPDVPSQAKSQFLEWLLPDRLSYVPKREGYFTRNGFRECGYFDVSSLGWEEFMWKDRPFGFHARGQLNPPRNFQNNSQLISILENLTRESFS